MTFALATHIADNAVPRQHHPVVLAGVGAAAIRVMQQPLVGVTFSARSYQQMPSYCARTLLKSSGMRTRSTTI